MTRRTLLALGLLLCAWIPLWPLFTGAYFPFQHDVFLSDLLHAHLPYRVELHQRLAHGQLPQWWSEIYSGVPFLAQVEVGAFYPPNLLTLALFDPYSGLNALWLINTLLGAISAWLFARVLGARPLVGSVLGVTWALSGGAIFHLKQVSFHAAILLIPLVLAAYWWASAKPGRWGWFAGAVGLHALAGMPQVTWMVLLTTGLFWLGSLVPSGPPDRAHWTAALRRAVGLGIASAVGLTIAAVTYLPAWGLKAVSARRDGLSWDYVADSYGQMITVWTLFLPLGPDPYDPGSRLLESWFYQGLIVLPLAAAALIAAGRKRWVLVGSAAALAPLMVATPVARWAFDLLPGMSLFRFHQRFGLLIAALLLGLAAIGLEGLVERVGPRLRPWIAVALVAFAVLDAAWFQRHHLRFEAWAEWTEPGAITEAIPPDGGEGRLLHHREFSRFEAISMTGAGPDPEPYRPLSDVPLGSVGALHDRWSAGGYTNLLDVRSSALFCRRFPETMPAYHQPPQWDDAAGRPSAAWQSMLDRSHTRWVLTDRPVSADLPVVATGASTLFENRTAMPRAYVTTSWRPVGSLAEAADWMHGPGAERADVPTIEHIRQPEAAAGRWVAAAVTDHRPEHLTIDVAGAAAGWLVLTDAHYPGWTAQIDGSPAEIRYANGYQRAVWLPAGSRTVEMRYRTPGLATGALLSGLAVIVWVLWLVVPGWWRRRVA